MRVWSGCEVVSGVMVESLILRPPLVVSLVLMLSGKLAGR